MADLEFSREEIENLAQRLSNDVNPRLDERETTLLKAIFAAAADHATPVGLGGGAVLPGFEIRNQAREAALADLQQELLNAYIPGNEEGGMNTFKVIGIPIGNPPPPPPLPGNGG